MGCKMKSRGLLLFLAAELFYVGTFIVVHRSPLPLHPPAFRLSGANGINWYYSDCRPVEVVEFYGFWPLRQLAYHIPSFMTHHLDECPDPIPELIRMGCKG
jgi:hypothetical protein